MLIKRLVSAAVLLLGAVFAAPVVAIPITDTVNPTDTTITFGSTPSPCPAGFTCSSGALSFVHDITDNGFTLGSVITFATLGIHLTDEGGSESYTLNFGAAQTLALTNVPSSSTDTFTLNAASIADLMADGKITVAVIATSGSFAFADSTLISEVTVVGGPSGKVPEPGSLALLSLALAAFACTRRRRHSRS
jgi:hypothetical protein